MTAMRVHSTGRRARHAPPGEEHDYFGSGTPNCRQMALRVPGRMSRCRGTEGSGLTTGPDVVTAAVMIEASTVASQPTLELPTAHSVQRAVVSTLERRVHCVRDLAAERPDELLEFVDLRLDGERDPFSHRRPMGQVVERL
jgi:hypothetical protein